MHQDGPSLEPTPSAWSYKRCRVPLQITRTPSLLARHAHTDTHTHLPDFLAAHLEAQREQNISNAREDPSSRVSPTAEHALHLQVRGREALHGKTVFGLHSVFTHQAL